jgi:hypothetical protein
MSLQVANGKRYGMIHEAIGDSGADNFERGRLSQVMMTCCHTDNEKS